MKNPWIIDGQLPGGSAGKLLLELKYRYFRSFNPNTAILLGYHKRPATPYAYYYINHIRAPWKPLVVSNPENLWDAASGTFTAAEAGIYLIQIDSIKASSQNQSYSKHKAAIEINGVLYHANAPLKDVAFRGYQDGESFPPLTIQVELKENDQVRFVTTTGNSTSLFCKSSSMTGGSLVHQFFGTYVHKGSDSAIARGIKIWKQ